MADQQKVRVSQPEGVNREDIISVARAVQERLARRGVGQSEDDGVDQSEKKEWPERAIRCILSC